MQLKSVTEGVFEDLESVYFRKTQKVLEPILTPDVRLERLQIDRFTGGHVFAMLERVDQPQLRVMFVITRGGINILGQRHPFTTWTVFKIVVQDIIETWDKKIQTAQKRETIVRKKVTPLLNLLGQMDNGTVKVEVRDTDIGNKTCVVAGSGQRKFRFQLPWSLTVGKSCGKAFFGVFQPEVPGFERHEVIIRTKNLRDIFTIIRSAAGGFEKFKALLRSRTATFEVDDLEHVAPEYHQPITNYVERVFWGLLHEGLTGEHIPEPELVQQRYTSTYDIYKWVMRQLPSKIHSDFGIANLSYLLSSYDYDTGQYMVRIVVEAGNQIYDAFVTVEQFRKFNARSVERLVDEILMSGERPDPYELQRFVKQLVGE